MSQHRVILNDGRRHEVVRTKQCGEPLIRQNVELPCTNVGRGGRVGL